MLSKHVVRNQLDVQKVLYCGKIQNVQHQNCMATVDVDLNLIMNAVEYHIAQDIAGQFFGII